MAPSPPAAAHEYQLGHVSMSLLSLQHVALLIQNPRLQKPNLTSVAQSVLMSMIEAITPHDAPITPSATHVCMASYPE
eukprot:3908573-Rhodomonas_salina.2